MEIILYALVVFIATALGATSGAGGGAIIKPVFDFIGIDNVTVIGMYSTIAVFAMCLSSIHKHSKSGVAFEKKVLYGLSVGSLLGGLVGDFIFKLVTLEISNSKVTLLQSFLLFFVLLSVFLFTRLSDRLPKYRIRNSVTIFFVGTLVGALSVFLGIGGGPLNVIVLVGFMSYNTKDSAPYSIAMIFFAQIPKIIKMIMIAQPDSFRWKLVPLIVIAAIFGGSIGTSINRKFSNKQVNFIYSCMMLALLILCCYNIVFNL